VVFLSVIRYNNNLLHLLSVSRRLQIKKERVCVVLRTVHIDGLSVRINYIHLAFPSVSLCGTEAREY